MKNDFKIGDNVSWESNYSGTIIYIDRTDDFILIQISCPQFLGDFSGSSKPADVCNEKYNLQLDPTAYFTWKSFSIVTVVAANEKQQAKSVTCCGCGDSNSYAESNLTNGNFICFSCRSSNSWKYRELLKS